jgi:hypothetical protein
MRRFLFAAMICALGNLAAAAPRSAPIPPPPPPQSQPPLPACVDARDTADYVPGVDAYGRPVAPADLPGSTTEVHVSTEVYVEMRSRNPRMPGVGVTANLPGLQKPPPCLKPPQSSVTIH